MSLFLAAIRKFRWPKGNFEKSWARNTVVSFHNTYTHMCGCMAVKWGGVGWSCVLPYIRVSYRHLLVWNWVEIFTICVCVLWRQRLGVEMFQCLSFCFLHENSSVPKHGRKKSHVLIWKWVRVSLTEHSPYSHANFQINSDLSHYRWA